MLGDCGGELPGRERSGGADACRCVLGSCTGGDDDDALDGMPGTSEPAEGCAVFAVDASDGTTTDSTSVAALPDGCRRTQAQSAMRLVHIRTRLPGSLRAC